MKNLCITTTSTTSSCCNKEEDRIDSSSSPQHVLLMNGLIATTTTRYSHSPLAWSSTLKSEPSSCDTHDSSLTESSYYNNNPLLPQMKSYTSNPTNNKRRKKELMNHYCRILYPHHVLPTILLLLLFTITLFQHSCCYAFIIPSLSFSLSSSSSKRSFIISHHQVVAVVPKKRFNNHNNNNIIILSSTKSSSKETIQAVQPLKSSSKEKRMSVQRAWEEQVQLLDLDSNNSSSRNSNSNNKERMNNEDISTPFLDLFADAGIASLKQVQQQQQLQQKSNNLSSSSSSSSSSTSKHVKPRGRPASVPGAMSRATMMGINEMETRTSSTFYNSNVSLFNNMNTNNSMMEQRRENNTNILTKDDFKTKQRSSSTSRLDVRRAMKQQSSSSPIETSSAVAASILKKKMSKGRGRGRPRKDKGNDASVDEITSIAAVATSSSSQNDNTSNNSSNDELVNTLNDIQNKAESEIEAKNSVTKSRRGELTTLRPKSKKMKESEKEGETTGMMQAGKGGKDGEPPNLQRYYRTELLTPQEEYTLGMKIQFMIHCEQVHDGLSLKYGQSPTIVEWARACGFKTKDPIDEDTNYMESDYVNQIRPLKSESIDPVEDANMFVGNGLVYESGPGRGRGRSKKRPPTKLESYYDDSDIKFESDFKEKEKSLKPLNRGTTMDFVELMIHAKEAKQRMVQCNMRLVVSISKRYKHVGVNIADLVQEGSIGLTRAAEKFDPKKGFKFSTYASWLVSYFTFPLFFIFSINISFT